MLGRDRQTWQIVVPHDPALWDPQRPGFTPQSSEPVSLARRLKRMDSDQSALHPSQGCSHRRLGTVAYLMRRSLSLAFSACSILTWGIRSRFSSSSSSWCSTTVNICTVPRLASWCVPTHFRYTSITLRLRLSSSLSWGQSASGVAWLQALAHPHIDSLPTPAVMACQPGWNSRIVGSQRRVERWYPIPLARIALVFLWSHLTHLTPQPFPQLP